MRGASGHRIARASRPVARRTKLARGGATALEGGVSNRVRGIESIGIAKCDRFAVE
jgi:hypothetical protein